MGSLDTDEQYTINTGLSFYKYFGLMMACIGRNLSPLRKLIKYKIVVCEEVYILFHFNIIKVIIFFLDFTHLKVDTISNTERRKRNPNMRSVTSKRIANLTSHRKPAITHFNSLSTAVPFIVRQFNGCSIFACIVLLKRGAYVDVKVRLWTWLETFCYGLNAVEVCVGRKLRSGTARPVFRIWWM